MDRELSIQKLSPEHEAKLAELHGAEGCCRAAGLPAHRRGRVPAPGGHHRAHRPRGGRADRRRDPGALPEQVRQRAEPDEEVALRKQAELRSVLVTGGRGASTSHELAAVHGWGVLVKPRTARASPQGRTASGPVIRQSWPVRRRPTMRRGPGWRASATSPPAITSGPRHERRGRVLRPAADASA